MIYTEVGFDQSFHAVDTQRSLGDFYDSGEPAYFYTRSLFDPAYENLNQF